MGYRVTVEELGAVRGALERLLGAHLLGGQDVARRIDWYYRGGPAGPPTIFALRHGPADEIVGSVALSPRDLRLEGQVVRAGLMGDFSVAAEHRTLFPALTLQRACRDHARKTVALSYGFPNRRATPVLRRLGYRPVARRLRYTRVLHPDVYLARRIGPPRLARALAAGMHQGSRALWQVRRLVERHQPVSWTSEPPEGIGDLWRRTAGRCPIFGRRDEATMRWRLARQPGARILFAATPAPNGSLGATAAVDLGGDGVARVRDLLAEDETRMGALLEALPAHLAARDMSAISITYAGASWVPALLRRHGFVHREQEDHGEPLVDAGERCPVPAERLRDPERWCLFDADEDT